MRQYERLKREIYLHIIKHSFYLHWSGREETIIPQYRESLRRNGRTYLLPRGGHVTARGLRSAHAQTLPSLKQGDQRGGPFHSIGKYKNLFASMIRFSLYTNLEQWRGDIYYCFI